MDRKPFNDVEKANRRIHNALNNFCIFCDLKDHIPHDCPIPYQNRRTKKSEILNSSVSAEDSQGKDSICSQETGNL